MKRKAFLVLVFSAMGLILYQISYVRRVRDSFPAGFVILAKVNKNRKKSLKLNGR